MDKTVYQAYTEILREELIPAMGCTEPIAIAYAAAIAARSLNTRPDQIRLCVSGNILKNVKSVIVPNTGGLHGLEAAAAAGIVAGDPDRKLLVISQVSQEQKRQIRDYLSTASFTVRETDSGYLFDIAIRLEGGGHSASCRIAGSHTNVIQVEKDGQALMAKEYKDQAARRSGRDLLQVEQIVEFADTVDLADVREPLERQIRCNMAIAREGLRQDYGARIGQVLLASYGSDVHTRAKAMAAAGSDARMGGCELPVIINSGSGNQGITTSVPVIVYAGEIGAAEDLLYRALVVSNLVTVHLKSGIGSLSAYCGATSAGCGAAAGISYLYGGRYPEIAHTIVNGLAINSGVVCDGAKASCAAKIASAVEAGLLGMQMYKHGTEFRGGDGIVTKGVENTIRNVSLLAREGMRKTDDEIIRIMLEN